MNRRQFIKLGGAAGAALLAPRALAPATAHAADDVATRLAAAGYAKKFTAPLPRPARVDLTDCRRPVSASMVQFQQQVLDGYPATTLWGYQHEGRPPSWPGATIVARQGRPVQMQWQNGRPVGTGTLAESHLLPVDTTLMVPEASGPARSRRSRTCTARTSSPRATASRMAGSRRASPRRARCGPSPRTTTSTTRAAARSGTTTTRSASRA